MKALYHEFKNGHDYFYTKEIVYTTNPDKEIKSTCNISNDIKGVSLKEYCKMKKSGQWDNNNREAEKILNLMFPHI